MTRKITIFDTTLRDGEQSPGASMNVEEKLQVARELLRLHVDVIEAGFPVSSPGDFDAVRRIADTVGDAAVVCALSRAVPADIETAARALDGCARPRIHTGIGVSSSHLADKLHITEEEALERAVDAVVLARRFTDDVQLYAEDAGRSDPVFLARIVEACIRAGATVIDIPDTTGYLMPAQFGERIRFLMERVDGIEDITVAVHCHNDLGMATASTLEGVRSGATQVECTINGLGERAGNTALEEIVMAIRLHGDDYLDAHTDIETTELSRASRLVSNITGIIVQPNKAIVGSNAFVHSSGIHQDGVIKDRSTYEIIDPADVGAGSAQIVLTARSGRHALRRRLEQLGYTIPDDAFEDVHTAFLALADKKKEIYDEDLDSLVDENGRLRNARWRLQAAQISCGFPLTPTATVTLIDPEGLEHTACMYGTGPIDAVYKAVDQIMGIRNELTEFSVKSVSRGIDALGEVLVRIAAEDGRIFSGRGSDGDIIVSATKAYLHALNKLLSATERSVTPQD